MIDTPSQQPQESVSRQQEEQLRNFLSDPAKTHAISHRAGLAFGGIAAVATAPGPIIGMPKLVQHFRETSAEEGASAGTLRRAAASMRKYPFRAGISMLPFAAMPLAASYAYGQTQDAIEKKRTELGMSNPGDRCGNRFEGSSPKQSWASRVSLPAQDCGNLFSGLY